jgi:nucleoside-diphosphate-sugar epimerase
MAGQNILVIGSSGFIGSHLTQLLADQGHTVVGLDKRPPAEPFGVAKFLRGDVMDEGSLRAAMEGIDTVINLAAVHADAGHKPHEYWDTNETGAKTLAKVMSDFGRKRLVFVSSMAVYGDRSDEPNENSDLKPTSVYGESKAAAEQVVRAWVNEDPSRAAVVIRPCVVYGERNVANMMNLIKQIDSGLFMMFGSGDHVKATAYVGNVVQALVGRMQAMQPGVQVYNYADKPDLPVQLVVKTIRDTLGRKGSPWRMPLWVGVLAAKPFDLLSLIVRRPLPVSTARVKKLALSTRMNAQKIRDAGFVQPVSSEEGIRRMVQHFMNGKQVRH